MARTKLTAVDRAKQALEKTRSELLLAKNEYSNARESLANGNLTVTPDKLMALREQVTYFELALQGAEHLVNEALKSEKADERDVLAAEVDSYAADPNGPYRLAQAAYHAAVTAIESFRELSEEHNAKYQDFAKRAREAGAAYEQGPARALTAIALKGQERYGVRGILTDRYSLHTIDAKRLAESVTSAKVDPQNAIPSPERKEPPRDHIYFRNKDGHSVGYEREHAPDAIRRVTLGWTEIKGEDVWPGWKDEAA